MQRDRLLIDEMIDAAERIIELVGNSPAEQISSNRDRRDAVLWNFTVLGEAANQVSDATRADHINIGWRDPIRVRNRIVHGYATVDVDILVAPAQRRRAEQVLEDLDFAPVIADAEFRSAFFDYFRQHNFQHRTAGTTVDFHWGFVGTGPFPVTAERALDSAVHWNLAGVAIPVPGPEAQALILAGHGRKENWASFGWVLDFATFAVANPALRWDLVAQAARAENCLEPLLGSVLLTREVFGVTIDQALLDSAMQRPVIVRNVAAVIGKLAALAERNLQDDLLSGFHLCETAPQRAAMVFALLTTPTIGDFEAWPLGPRWWWTYRVTRPVRLALRALARRAPTRSRAVDPR